LRCGDGSRSKDRTVRLNAWSRARINSKEFTNCIKQKVETVEVPDQLRWLAKGPNRVSSKRYTAYFINGYWFHTLLRDSTQKSHKSGVSLAATTDTFSSPQNQNPIDGYVIYYAAIQDIIELDYYGCS